MDVVHEINNLMKTPSVLEARLHDNELKPSFMFNHVGKGRQLEAGTASWRLFPGLFRRPSPLQRGTTEHVGEVPSGPSAT